MKNRCIHCSDEKSKNKTALEKYLELDPEQVIKMSNELLDEFVIFDKLTNMTKKQHFERIIKIENRLDNIEYMLNILLGKSNNKIIVNEMKLYLIDIGDAETVVSHHFYTHPGEEPILKDKRILVYGLTDNIEKTIKIYNRMFNHIGTTRYEVNYICSVVTDSLSGSIKEKCLREKLNRLFENYTFHDKADYKNTFDNKLIICSKAEINNVVEFIKSI